MQFLPVALEVHPKCGCPRGLKAKSHTLELSNITSLKENNTVFTLTRFSSVISLGTITKCSVNGAKPIRAGTNQAVLTWFGSVVRQV